MINTVVHGELDHNQCFSVDQVLRSTRICSVWEGINPAKMNSTCNYCTYTTTKPWIGLHKTFNRATCTPLVGHRCVRQRKQ